MTLIIIIIIIIIDKQAKIGTTKKEKSYSTNEKLDFTKYIATNCYNLLGIPTQISQFR